jgi:RNA polymerase sigma factor (sigma-70 family)
MAMTAYSNVEPGKDSRNAAAYKKIAGIQQKHGQAFYKLARARGLCHDDALNVVQTSLLAMRERLSRKGPVKNDLSYFWAIINNQIAQFYRERKNAKEKPLGDLRDVIPAATMPPADRQPTGIWPAGKILMLCAANQAVEELSGPHREVYELAVIAGMEPADIAQMLEKKPGTVRAYLSVAREQVNTRANELLAELELHERPKHCGEK